MNPALIRALGRESRAELLRAWHFRDTQLQWRHQAETPTSVAQVADRPLSQLRRALGSVLVGAGTRLMATHHVTVD